MVVIPGSESVVYGLYDDGAGNLVFKPMALDVDGKVIMSAVGGGAGDASAAKQDAQTALLVEIEANTSASGGDATAAHQVTQNGLLTDIEANTDGLETAVALLGTEVTLASVLTALNSALTKLDTQITKLAGGLPANLDSDQLKVSLAATPLPTDAATQTTLAAILEKIIAAPATETTAASILAALAATLTTKIVDLNGEDLGDSAHPISIAQIPVSGHIMGDDAAFTPGTTSVQPVGFFADETAPDSVDEGDTGAARMTLDRKQIVVDRPHASGGCLPFYNLDVDESEDAIKASPGQLYELNLINTTNAIIYAKLYNATTANVTVGSTTPVLTIPVPANNDLDGAGMVRNWPKGLGFDTAITIAATTGFADNDTGAPGANALMVNGAYF